MPVRMLTLFGEEIVPENLKGAPKPVVQEDPQASGVPAARKSSGRSEGTSVLSGWKPEKQYYTIGEVAKLFDVRTSHIRFWTTEFRLKVRTTRNGDRLYTPADIASLRSIYHLVKERGFTIPGAKAALKEAKGAPTEQVDLKQALLQLRNQLILIRNELL